MSRRTRLLRLLGWAAGIGVALYVLAASGRGALSPPPLTTPGRWQAWAEQRDPAAAAFAILRLVAVAGCWYLAATTVVGAALRLVRADVLVAVADRVTVAPVRHLLAGSLTLTLVGIGPTAALATSAPPPAPDHHHHDLQRRFSLDLDGAGRRPGDHHRHHHHAPPTVD